MALYIWVRITDLCVLLTCPPLAIVMQSDHTEKHGWDLFFYIWYLGNPGEI